MMNVEELKQAIKYCCGNKVDTGEEICQRCKKRMRRIKNIQKQIDKMWKDYEAGRLRPSYGPREPRSDRHKTA